MRDRSQNSGISKRPRGSMAILSLLRSSRHGVCSDEKTMTLGDGWLCEEFILCKLLQFQKRNLVTRTAWSLVLEGTRDRGLAPTYTPLSTALNGLSVIIIWTENHVAQKPAARRAPCIIDRIKILVHFTSA